MEHAAEHRAVPVPPGRCVHIYIARLRDEPPICPLIQERCKERGERHFAQRFQRGWRNASAIARRLDGLIDPLVAALLSRPHGDEFPKEDRAAIHRLRDRLHEPQTADFSPAGHTDGEDIAAICRKRIVDTLLPRVPLPVGTGNIRSTRHSQLLLRRAKERACR